MGKSGKIYRSPPYLRWIKSADQIFVMTKPKGPIWKQVGPFNFVLQLHSTSKRRGDADNRIKAALDYCTRIGLIEDDSLAQWVVAGWVNDPTVAPYGAFLTIAESQKEGLPELGALIASLAGDAGRNSGPARGSGPAQSQAH